MKNKPQVPDLVPRLTPQQVYHMLAGILNDQSLFTAVREQLKGEYFSQPFDAPLRVVWEVVCEAVRVHGLSAVFSDRVKAHKLIEIECVAYAQSQPDLCTADSWSMLFGEAPNGFIRWVYSDFDVLSADRNYLASLFSAFLRERAVSDFWKSMLNAAGDGVVSNLAEMATSLGEKIAASKSIITAGAIKSAAPPGWLPSPVCRRPTGITWLDKFLRGGHAAKETYLLLGAIGSGKTTFGLQLLTSVAEMEWVFALSPEARDLAGLPPTDTYDLGHVYYFHYEMPEEDIRARLWSGAAQIELDRILRMGTSGFSLSPSANLTKADQEMLKRVRHQSGALAASIPDAAFPGEAARLERAMQLLTSNVWQVDCMSGAVGTGYVHEIASMLSAERKAGKRIACVVIDYASSCVERAQPDKDKQYAMLDAFGQLTESLISVPFNTPVWVLQQLKGVSNQRTAASRPHHSDALGCTTMGKAFWFAFGIGTTDEKTGCRYFACSKARRADLGSPPILKIAGGFNRLIDVSDEYHFDSSGKIREKGVGSTSTQSAWPPMGVIP